jgi:hypothetical protein
MLPITKSIRPPHLALDLDKLKSGLGESNPTVIESDSHVINLKKRIDENCHFLDELKKDRQFQNLLTLMRKAAIPEKLLLNFLIGWAPLQDCLKSTWMEDLITKTYSHGFWAIWAGVYTADGRYYFHYLKPSFSHRLSTIFSYGYFESEDKFHSKMKTFMGAIETENISGKLDLSFLDLSDVWLDHASLTGADCRGVKFGKVKFRLQGKINLTGADCRGANFGTATVNQMNLAKANLLGVKTKDPVISRMVKEQELFEKYKLLLQITAGHSFNFPRELIKHITLELKPSI